MTVILKIPDQGLDDGNFWRSHVSHARDERFLYLRKSSTEHDGKRYLATSAECSKLLNQQNLESYIKLCVNGH